jgi:hypothetical protein
MARALDVLVECGAPGVTAERRERALRLLDHVERDVLPVPWVDPPDDQTRLMLEWRHGLRAAALILRPGRRVDWVTVDNEFEDHDLMIDEGEADADVVEHCRGLFAWLMEEP